MATVKTLAQLLASAPTAGGFTAEEQQDFMVSVYAETLIERVTLGSDAASITVTGIPAYWRDLYCVVSVKTDRTNAASDNLWVRMGDGSIASGASDYAYTWFSTGNTSPGADSNAAAQIVGATIPGSPTADPEATVFGGALFTIVRYADATVMKYVDGTGGMNMPVSNVNYQSRFNGLYRNATAVVDQVQILPQDGANLKAGSSLTVYGRGVA